MAILGAEKGGERKEGAPAGAEVVAAVSTAARGQAGAEVADTTIDTDQQTPEDRKNEAKALVASGGEEEKPPAVDEDDIPDNKYGEAYKLLKAEMKDNPEMNNQLGNLALALLSLASRFVGYQDMFSGEFLKRLDDDPALREQTLSDGDIQKIRTGKGQKPVDPDEKLQRRYGDAGIAKASTMYASMHLIGVEIEDTSVFAAKLKNARKKIPNHPKDPIEVPYYRTADLDSLKSNGMPYGTVIIFTGSIWKAQKITAFATGNGDECAYYDPRQGEKRTFRLNGPDSPIKIGAVIQAALVPQFNSDAEYFTQHQDQLDQQLEEPQAAASTAPAVATQSNPTDAPASQPNPTGVPTAIAPAPVAAPPKKAPAKKAPAEKAPKGTN